jgi:Family of unknown function (DUF5335)
MEILTRTEEIPKKRWRKFLDDFGRRHEGWRVKVEELIPDRGAQTEAVDLPFFGATYEPEPPGSVTIELGGAGTDHIEHRISGPSRIWVESLANGAEAALEIEAEGDRKTLISFRSPQPTESVDGLPEVV